MITVKVFATYRKLLGDQKEVILNPPNALSTRQTLETLFQDYPDLQPEILDEDGKILPHVSVFANGRDVRHLQGLDTLLEPGQTLSLFPPVAGG